MTTIKTTTKIIPRFKRKRKPLPDKTNKKSNSNSNSNNKSKPVKLISNNGNGNNGNSKLTPRQAKFVDEYLIDLNATQAAIRAGYSKKTSNVYAFQILDKLSVQQEIQKRRNELSAIARIDQEWVLKRYEMLSDYCIDDFIDDNGEMKPFSEIPKDKLYAIGGFKQTKRTITTKDKELITNRIKEFKLPDKKSVLDSIRNQLGFEKNNQGGDRGQGGINIEKAVIQVNLVNDDGDKVG